MGEYLFEDVIQNLMNWAGRNVLITGGAGHIGSALTSRLVENGAHVKVADNLWRGSKDYLLDDHGKPIINFEKDFYEVDLREYQNCTKVIQDVDIIFHLADVVAGITYVFDNQAFVYRSNAMINSNVFESSSKAKVDRLVYVGAACAYPHYKQNDPEQPLFKEQDMYPAQPESAYGWSKLMGEYECDLYDKSGQMKTAILRLHNVYGPHSDLSPERSQVIPATIRKAIRYPKERFLIWGNGRQSRSFVYVDDVVDALLLAAERGVGKGPIQIGTDTKTTIDDLADTIIDISGKKIVKEHDLSKPVGDFGRAADCTLANMLLGWKPKTSLKEGLERTYHWAHSYLKSRNEI